MPFINSDPDQKKDVMFGEAYNITINVSNNVQIQKFYKITFPKI